MRTAGMVELKIRDIKTSDVGILTSAAESFVQELKEHHCDVEIARRQSPTTAGSKDAGTLLDGGKLLLALGASGGALSTLIVAAQAWLLRNQQNKISMKIGDRSIELSGISSRTQDKIIEEFLAQLRKPAENDR